MTSSASGAELAINYADGKLFYKDSGGVVQVLATKATALSTVTNNGVVYVNSSGQATSGSALIFDGTNLGLGVTPSAWNSSSKAFQFGTNGTAILENFNGLTNTFGFNTYRSVSSGYVYTTTGNAAALFGTSYTGGFSWSIAPSGTAGNAITFTQAMTLDVSGNLLVGTTSSGITNSNCITLEPTTVNQCMNMSHYTGTSSGVKYIAFGYAGSTIGSITQNGTTAVLYNTTSDYRLKSNVVPVTTGLSVINQLNPVNFTWISDNESDTGFLAHEFQTVIPRAVTGTKDATIEEEYEVTPAVKDEQGNITTPAVMGTRTVPVYQQMDNSGAVPYLVAAIKELSAQVTSLQATVETQATTIATLQNKIGA